MVVAMGFDWDFPPGSVNHSNAVGERHADTNSGDGNPGLLAEAFDLLSFLARRTEKQFVVFASTQGVVQPDFTRQRAKGHRNWQFVSLDNCTDTTGFANMAQILNQSVADIDHRRRQLFFC